MLEFNLKNFFFFRFSHLNKFCREVFSESSVQSFWKEKLNRSSVYDLGKIIVVKVDDSRAVRLIQI
jgi:hypothetical protein